MELQTWQSLLESKHRTDKNRSIEYFQRKKKISYLKESKFWLNLFLFLETKWEFLTKQLSKLQNISDFKESRGCYWFAAFNRSAWSAPRNGTVWGRSHQPPQTCCFPNSLLISPVLFASTAAEREGCWGAACAFWISQPVWASDGHVSLYSPRRDVLTSASCLWHQAALCQLFALCCVLEGPCWGLLHAPGAIQTLNCRKGATGSTPRVPGHGVEARRSQCLIPWGFPCGKKLQEWTPGGRCAKGLGKLGNAAPRKDEVVG